MNTLTFDEEPILEWNEYGVYIHEKYRESDKNIFIYYHSMVCVVYNVKTIADCTTSKITVYLSNGLIIELGFNEEVSYIFQDFRKHRVT